MPPGRPSKLEIDDTLRGKIMAMVRAGMFPERAAIAAGVAERTHYLWQSKGLEEREHREAGKTPRKTWQVYLDYANELEQAVAEAEFLLVGTIAKGGGTAQTMALLERRFRDRWSGKAPAAPPTVPTAPTSGTNVTPLAAATARREQRRVTKPG